MLRNETKSERFLGGGQFVIHATARIADTMGMLSDADSADVDDAPDGGHRFEIVFPKLPSAPVPGDGVIA